MPSVESSKVTRSTSGEVPLRYQVMVVPSVATVSASNADAALEALTVATDGTTITWYRSGTSPEVDRVTFELSTDGINYAALATPTRIAGGWQLPGQDLPTRQNIFVRARGFYSTGESAGSDSIAESVRNAFISLSFLF